MCPSLDVWWLNLLSRYRLSVWSLQMNQHSSVLLSTFGNNMLMLFVISVKYQLRRSFYSVEFLNRGHWCSWKATNIQSEIMCLSTWKMLRLLLVSVEMEIGAGSFNITFPRWPVWPVLILKPVFYPHYAQIVGHTLPAGQVGSTNRRS